MRLCTTCFSPLPTRLAGPSLSRSSTSTAAERQFDPATAIEERPFRATLRRVSSELLEEERHASAIALIAQIFEPLDLCGPRARLTLASGDQPLNPFEVEFRKRSEKWLGGNETHSR